MDRLLSRRQLFLGGASLGLGGALLAACSRSSTDADITVTSRPGRTGGGLNLLSPSGDVPVGTGRRVAWLLKNDAGDFVVPSGPVLVGFGPQQGKVQGAVVPAAVHTDSPGVPAYITVQRDFPQTGTLWATVKANGGQASAPVSVVDHLPGPGVGDPVPLVPTPTVADAQGVDPICTHDPPCGLHQLSLNAAVADGMPVVLAFATPRYCQSETCGPVLDTILAARGAAHDRAHFIHVEIYARPTPDAAISSLTLAPTVTAFKLQSEPSLFLVNPNGTVHDRIEGLFGAEEATTAISSLVKQ